MKKKLLTAGCALMLCLLGGCLEATPLTDEDMDVVAEYAASLLLKYDRNYDTPLYYEKEREILLTPTVAVTATPTPEPTPTSKPLQGEDSESFGAGADENVTPEPTPTPLLFHEEEISRQLTEIIAAENITVTCAGYDIMKSVQSNEYFSLIAKEGRQYVMVTFLLHNNTEEELVFDASGNDLEYSLDINTDSISRVSLSMLENDLQYMAIPIPAGKTEEAVLVFEIADTEISTMHLIIENDSEEAVFAKLK